MKKNGPICVLLVQASPLFHTLVAGAVSRYSGIRVLPGANCTAEVRDRILDYHPDVILIDLALPGEDCLNLIRSLREHYPVPIIACSGSSKGEVKGALQLIEAGALDVIAKPEGFGPGPIRKLGEDLALKIHTAFDDARPGLSARPTKEYVSELSFRGAGIAPGTCLIVVGASTGGTEALRVLLEQMPTDAPPIAIVQHMPASFTASFAENLNFKTKLSVSEARDGEPLVPGRVLIARGDTHLTVDRISSGWVARYTHQQKVNRHCPSVDVLFDSAVRSAGKRAIGILLTGMGADGAQGLLRLRQAGALTIAQDAQSCVVFGMPKVAQQLGAAQLIGPPQNIPSIMISGLVKLRMKRLAASAAGLNASSETRSSPLDFLLEQFNISAYDLGMANEIKTEVRDQIGIVRLNRPNKMNALNYVLMTQVIEALEGFDKDQNIRCILLTGDERAFAAGADINEMADTSMIEMYHRDMFGRWDRIKKIQKPIVAAVSGYALGGGCELVMCCDIVIASESARFGQPEINLGIIPGAGGTQRLTRAVGKAQAMDLILTGRMLTADEALAIGLISRVVPAENWFDETLKICGEICQKAPIALQAGKDAVNRAFETTLHEGLDAEKKLFYMLFATDDQKEGMRAFQEKRKPIFVGR